METDLFHFIGDGVFQFVDAFSGYGGDGEQFQIVLLAIALELSQFFFIGDVDFGSHHNYRLLFQVSSEARQFFVDDFDIFDRIWTSADI